MSLRNALHPKIFNYIETLGNIMVFSPVSKYHGHNSHHVYVVDISMLLMETQLAVNL